MRTYEKLCQAITTYEKSCLADDWNIHYRELYKGVTFDNLCKDVEKFGMGKQDFVEIAKRVDYYFDELKMECGEEDWDALLEVLKQSYNAYEILDRKFNEKFVEWAFGISTPEEIVDQWRIDAEYEAQKETEAEFIDKLAMPMLVNDCGLSECEAEEFLFDLGY